MHITLLTGVSTQYKSVVDSDVKLYVVNPRTTIKKITTNTIKVIKEIEKLYQKTVTKL